MAGRVLGTTDYVSPEQALGQAVTAQSDLYSLGIVLYEMLTGDVPFHGETPVAVAMKHVREEVPDVQARRPEMSAATAAVVDRALAKDLSRRYPDAAAMVGRPRRGARDRGLAHGPDDGRGHDRAAHAARAGPAAAAVADAPPGALARLARADRRDRGGACSCSRRTGRTAAPASPPGTSSKSGLVPVQPRRVGRARLQPVRHRPGKPRPDRQRRRQRPAHDLDAPRPTTKATCASPAASGSGSTSTPRPGSPRGAIAIQTPTPGFAAQVYVADHIDLSLPYGSSQSLSARGWVGPDRLERRRCTTAEQIALHRQRARTATTCCGSPRCRPGSSRRRSPTSRCSAEPAGVSGAASRAAAWRSSASRQSRSTSSG